MRDLRFALRSLARNPGFTVIAVLTLGLGIGLSASSFSFANTFLLRNVPYPEARRLVRIFRTSRQSANRPHAPANLLEVRDAVTSYSHVAIYNDDNFALGEPGKPAEQVGGLQTTAEFFELLGVRCALGRAFLPGEDAPGQDAVAVLTHRGWVNRYGGDPGVVGRTVRLNSQPYTIVGVLPESFEAPLVWGSPEFVMPRVLEPEFRTQRTSAWMQCVARLKPGVSLRQAQSELDTIASRLAQHYPTENGNDGLRVVALHDSNMDGIVHSLMWLMTGVALTMLLIACANLASLQVARGLGRSREFAVRAALGGGQRQLMAPLLFESLVLSLAGGALGLLVASWTNELFGRLLVINGASGLNIVIDGRVFGFAAFSSLLSAIAFGLAPAWLATRSPATAEALKEGARAATGSRAHQRLKHALIVAELGLTIVLVGAAAAFGIGARSFLRRELGWQPDGIFAGYFVLPPNRYNDYDRTREFHRALLERLAALPGVEHVTLARRLPIASLDGMGRTTRLVVENQLPLESGCEPTAEVDAVSADFFATLRIPLKQGSLFAPNVRHDDPLIVVINETCAERFWPGENPVGRRVRFVPGEQWLEIIGVVGDVRMATRLGRPETLLQLYRPLAQVPTRYTSVAVRAATPPEALTSEVRQTMAALDPDLPLAQAGALLPGLVRSFSNFNLVIVNLGISAGLALLIAAVGLFGVISQLTLQRTRDIGVRIALGASSRSIMGMILGEGAKLLVAGIAAGVPLFYVVNFILHRTMPEVPLPGLWLLVTNLAVLALTMFIAAWLPARRAAHVDPIVALRAE
jgi:predicted permease